MVFLTVKKELALVSILSNSSLFLLFCLFVCFIYLFFIPNFFDLNMPQCFFLFLEKAVQAAYRAEEIVISTHRTMKDEEARCAAIVKTFEVA